MQMPDISTAEMIDYIKDMVDTLWLIDTDRGKVAVLRDSMIPELEGTTQDYTVLSDMFAENYVYSADVELWNEVLNLPALQAMAAEGTGEKRLDIRFYNSVSGFEWHKSAIRVLRGQEGRPDRIMLTGQNIHDKRKSEIVARAVQTEYDYVAYIEASKNSYVMYHSNKDSGTPIPPVSGSDYEGEVVRYNGMYVVEEECEDVTRNLLIDNVRPYLEQDGEFLIFAKMKENGRLRDKLMRFSYFDREKDIWLLTRTDITEIQNEKRQRELLQDALNAAKMANQAKSEFLSRMSHDIRTPMNAIIGMTAIAGAHIEDRERVTDCLSKITMSSRLLLSLINEVLDMSKIESGKIVLAEEDINLPELLQGIVAMIQPMIRVKKHAFDIRLNGLRHEKLIGDRQRLEQVFLNLLSNAVKYTPDEGRVLFEIREKPSGQRGMGCFEFVIEDNGIGMRPDFLERLFQPFERADDDAIRAIQGTGLGMAISKNIVEMMDGDIKVESTYGKGARFTVTICLRIQEQTNVDSGILHDLPVLVVDDDKIVCQNTCERLSDLGMRGEWTLNGYEAVDRTAAAHERGEDYFAVIVDLKMPGIDGIETTRRIRARVGYEVPIIMISAYDWSEYEAEAKAAGVDGFIMKPLFRSQLAWKLKQFASKDEVRTQESTGPLVQGTYNGSRILLVEDNLLNQEIAQELLSSTGAAVETADNGKIAVEKVERSSENYYDLILMDMQMPVMDGCEAARVIRGLDRLDVKTMPIVAMTANAFSEDVEKTRRAGMNEHMAKPIDLKRLSQTLERWLNRS